jgi:hypothetical protein
VDIERTAEEILNNPNTDMETNEEFIKCLDVMLEDKRYAELDNMTIFEANKQAKDNIWFKSVKSLQEKEDKAKKELDRLQKRLELWEYGEQEKHLEANSLQEKLRKCKPWEIKRKSELKKQIEALWKPTEPPKTLTNAIDSQKELIANLGESVKRQDDIYRIGNMNEFEMLTHCPTLLEKKQERKPTETKKKHKKSDIRSRMKPID